MDVYISGDYAYLANGYRGLRILDVSNPAEPQEVGYWVGPYFASDVAVENDLAIVAAGLYGGVLYVFIINVADPTAPTEIGSLLVTNSNPDQDWELSVSDSHVYMVGDTGIHIIDIGTPTSPIEVGYIGSVRGAQGVDSTEDFFYIGDAFTGLLIYQNGALRGIGGQ